jgi:hypothetical protein
MNTQITQNIDILVQYLILHYLNILTSIYVCGSMHVFSPFYLVPPDDGSAEPKHEGEYTV